MQRTQRNEFFLTDKKLVNKKKKKKKKEKNLKVKTIYEEYLAVPATPLSPADQPDKSVSSTQQASERAPTVALAAVLPLLPPRTQHRWAGHVVNPNVNKVWNPLVAWRLRMLNLWYQIYCREKAQGTFNMKAVYATETKVNFSPSPQKFQCFCLFFSSISKRLQIFSKT